MPGDPLQAIDCDAALHDESPELQEEQFTGFLTARWQAISSYLYPSPGGDSGPSSIKRSVLRVF